MSDRPVCVNCKHEDASQTSADTHGRTAIWCAAKQQYIDSYSRQGVRLKGDGTTEEYYWCGQFSHYRNG